ncbi:flippase [Haloarcula laminariae]|uniref:flippase n=1 Tax=Haloarcula laminariae TaxID=2961577 RepID=UPI0021C91BEC|nr:MULTISPECIES: flippase [Halomicroarcula]
MGLRDELAGRFRAQLAGKIIRAVGGSLLTVGLARLLDPDGYGLLFLALSVVTVFQLVTIGIGRSAGRYIAEYREQDRSQLRYIVRDSSLILVAVMLVAVLVLTGSATQIASLFDEPALRPFLLVGSLFVVLWMAITFLEKVLQGFEAIRFVAVMGSVGRLSRVALALGLVAAGFGALGALWGYVVSALLTTALGTAYLLRQLRQYDTDGSGPEPGLRRRIFEYAVPTTATNMSRYLDHQVDTLLVGYFLSPVAVSFYVIAEQVVNFLETPLSALGFTLSPTFGAQKAAGNVEQMSRIYEDALLNGLLLYVPAGVGLVLVARPTVTLVFGAEYSGAVPVLQVLGLYVILKAITKVSDNGLDYLGRARERAVARVITALLNVGLTVALIQPFGVTGAALATLITHGLYTATNVYISAQEFQLRAGFLLRRAGKIVGVSLVMAAVVFALSGYISGWLTLALVVGAGVLVWAVLSVTTGLLEPRQVVAVVT